MTRVCSSRYITATESQSLPIYIIYIYVYMYVWINLCVWPLLAFIATVH